MTKVPSNSNVALAAAAGAAVALVGSSLWRRAKNRKAKK